MKIALASFEFKNNYSGFNCNQIIRNMGNSAEQGVDLICFGEAFLQGPESLLWRYQADSYIAVKQNSMLINKIRQSARENCIGVGFGYMELDDRVIYSSYMVLDKRGDTVCNYRRVSPGWFSEDSNELTYRAGEGFSFFVLDGHRFTVALGRDLWHDENIIPINEAEAEVVLWPVYCDHNPAEWAARARAEYAERSRLFNKPLLWINSICRNPLRAFGGAAMFNRGIVVAEGEPQGVDSLLHIEI